MGYDKSTALRRLCIARDLSRIRRLLKQPSDILEETIRAYAAGSVNPVALMPRPDRRHHAAILHKIAGRQHEVRPNDVPDPRRCERRTAEFQGQMARGSAGLLEELTAWYSQRELGALPFADSSAARPMAAALADRKGLADACRERGLAGLLRVRTVRLCAGVVMSQIHTEISAGRKPDLGDVVMTSGTRSWLSTADVFYQLATRGSSITLARVPDVHGFRVVKSLGKALVSAE